MNLSTFLTLACATCVSQDGQVTTLAANGAVYVMLGALALVFTAGLSVVITFVRRARRQVPDGPAVRPED